MANDASFKMVERLAKQGDAGAQFSLGCMYANGNGVAKDEAKAAKWFRNAADQDHSGAQYNLGLIYQNGRGGAEDKAKAIAFAPPPNKAMWRPCMPWGWHWPIGSEGRRRIWRRRDGCSRRQNRGCRMPNTSWG
jgi:TPR repeat protein